MSVMLRHQQMAGEHGYDENENGDIAAQPDNRSQKSNKSGSPHLMIIQNVCLLIILFSKQTVA